MCLKKLRDQAKFFFTLSWMSFLIYFLLMKLQEVQLYNNGMKSRMRDSEERLLMNQLGFIEHPKLYPQAYHYLEEKEWPVFTMALCSNNMHNLVDFLISFRKYFLDHRLVIYAVDLSKTEKRIETLQEFGSVFWCDVAMRFISGSVKPVLSAKAMSSGILAWPQDEFPTSTFTDPNLYKHFNTNQSVYFFQQMVSPVPGFYVNTEKLHNHVMKPWILCVLDELCLSPRGAQYNGCVYTIKPRYKYASCHRYAISAFNIILGQAYKNEKSYLVSQDLFIMVPQRHQSVVDMIKNITKSVIS